MDKTLSRLEGQSFLKTVGTVSGRVIFTDELLFHFVSQYCLNVLLCIAMFPKTRKEVKKKEKKEGRKGRHGGREEGRDEKKLFLFSVSPISVRFIHFFYCLL